MRLLVGIPVGLEKLSSRKSAEIRSRQEALRTIFLARLDIFYHANFGFLQKKASFSTASSRRLVRKVRVVLDIKWINFRGAVIHSNGAHSHRAPPEPSALGVPTPAAVAVRQSDE
jgi:hypothetical protein